MGVVTSKKWPALGPKNLKFDFPYQSNVNVSVLAVSLTEPVARFKWLCLKLKENRPELGQIPSDVCSAKPK